MLRLVITIILAGLVVPCCASAQLAKRAQSETSTPSQPSASIFISDASQEAESIQPVAFSAPDNSATSLQLYGSVWGRMYHSTSRTSPGSFTVWVPSREDQGEAAFEIDARSSRIGLLASRPTLPSGFAFTGRVELDFFGQFLTENRANARLRHAYMEAVDDRWRFLVGQTWDVVSPLNPGMLNFSVGWSGGNIGFRRAQFRVERSWQLAGLDGLIQASLNQDIVPDFPVDAGIRRESANYPVLQSRVAVSTPNWTLGASGHFGETGFDFMEPGPPPLSLPPQEDARFKTWSFNVDCDVQLTSALAMRGEFFRGANLSPFLGGIGQGVCPCVRQEINTVGGWVALEYQWNEAFASHIGLGIDDPFDDDTLFGRVQNNFIFANLVWQLTDGFSTGWEVAWWRTLYQERRAGLIPPEQLESTAPGEAVTLEWMVRYDW